MLIAMHGEPSGAKVVPTVSAIVVCFNEEQRIGDCLESLRWCDEIVVVDSFSTDRTPEICRRYTDRFIQREWAGYRDQKAFAHSQATQEWVLLADSDERVTAELRDEIQTSLAGDGGEYVGLRCAALGALFGPVVASRRMVSRLRRPALSARPGDLERVGSA